MASGSVRPGRPFELNVAGGRTLGTNAGRPATTKINVSVLKTSQHDTNRAEYLIMSVRGAPLSQPRSCSVRALVCADQISGIP